MSDEPIDICDESNNLTGIQKMKSKAHRDGLWHRNSHIWIYNLKGGILLQLRAEKKFIYPGVWDISVAGHVSAGEEPIEAAIKEVGEEIGLKIEPEDLLFFKIKKVKTIYKEIKNNEFYYVYFLKFDGNIEKLKLQTEEVQKIQFFSIKKIEEELKNEPDKYAPHGDYWREVIEEIKKHLT